MFCPNCGKELAEGAAFCKECGTRVTPATERAMESKPCCPGCGRELPEGALFCKACGTRIADAASTATGAVQTQRWQTPVANVPQGQTPGAQRQTPATNTPQGQTPNQQWRTPAAATPSAQMPPAAPQGAAGAHRPNRTRNVLIAAIAAVALLAGGIGGFMLWSGQRQAHDESVAASAAYDAAHERHAVVFKVDAAEYSDTTATKIPVHVAGSDVDGAAVDEDAYVDAEGRGVELAEGIYAITVVTSPLTSDGTVYDVPTTSWDVTIGTDAGAGADVDATSQPIALSPVSDYTAVSDETIQRMYDYASKSGIDQATVDSYKSATTSRIQAAKDQKVADEAAAAEAQRQAEEAAKKAALHYENEYFSLEVPESWRDNYTVTEGSGHASTQGAGASSGTSTKSYGFESSVKATLGAAWGSTPANEVFEIDVAPSSAGTSLWFTGNDPGEYIGTTSSGYTVWYRTSIKFEDHEDFDYVRNSITLK